MNSDVALFDVKLAALVARAKSILRALSRASTDRPVMSHVSNRPGDAIDKTAEMPSWRKEGYPSNEWWKAYWLWVSAVTSFLFEVFACSFLLLLPILKCGLLLFHDRSNHQLWLWIVIGAAAYCILTLLWLMSGLAHSKCWLAKNKTDLRSQMIVRHW